LNGVNLLEIRFRRDILIEVNDYSSIGFARWVNKTINYENINEYNIEEIVDQYIEHNSRQWNLRFFLKLFQDYSVSNVMHKRTDFYDFNETTIVECFKRFCTEENSMKYIFTESIYKRAVLKPLLSDFALFLKNNSEYDVINNEILRIAEKSCKNNGGLVWWFTEVVEIAMQKLSILMEVYLANTLNHGYLIEYQKWLIKKASQNRNAELAKMDIFDNEIRKWSIIYRWREGLKFETDDNYGGVQRCTSILPDEESYVLIDFLEFLKSKKITILKYMPYLMLDELAGEYLVMNPEVKEKDIKSFIKLLNNKKNLLWELKKLFNRPRGKSFDLDRYSTRSAHGIMLFRSSDKLSLFLKKYWNDLHHLSGDILDIYFTNEDLKNDTSCYSRIKKFVNLEIEFGEYPCFVVWNSFDNKECISLKELTHNEIFDVIERLTMKLRNNDLKVSAEVARGKVKEILHNKKEVHIINHYEIKDSQIGAVGENAVAKGSVFNQK